MNPSNAITLNFINNSNDTNNSSVVIFQKNVATNYAQEAVAWKAINTSAGDSHAFTFPLANTATAHDSSGTITAQAPVQHGQLFHVTSDAAGNAIVHQGAATSQTEVQVKNALQQGSINANIYKDGKLLATQTAVAPEQHANFTFKPTIWIGVVAGVNEGDVLDSAKISNINTELSLLGVASADIIMTGGGQGPNSTPYTFTLENIVNA